MTELNQEKYCFEASFCNSDGEEFEANHQMSEETCDRFVGLEVCWKKAIAHFASQDAQALEQFQTKFKNALNYHAMTDLKITYKDGAKQKRIICFYTNYQLIG